MSFKDWSSAQKSGSESKPGDKSKVAPAIAQPAITPDQKPAVVGPVNKT